MTIAFPEHSTSTIKQRVKDGMGFSQLPDLPTPQPTAIGIGWHVGRGNSQRHYFETAWYAKLFQGQKKQQLSLKVLSLAMVAACLITTAIVFLPTLLHGYALTAFSNNLCQVLGRDCHSLWHSTSNLRVQITDKRNSDGPAMFVHLSPEKRSPERKH